MPRTRISRAEYRDPRHDSHRYSGITCVENKYTATFTISGGTPPYTVNGKSAPANTFTTEPVASGTEVTVEVRDSVNCTLKTSLTRLSTPVP